MTTPDKDPPNLGLLIKLLKMTTSTSDAEALSAMRKANEQLAKFGGDWERLLLGKVKIIADPFSSIQAPPAPRPRQAPEPFVPRPQAYNPPPPPSPKPTATELRARQLEAEMRERVKLQRAKDRERAKERLRAQAANLSVDDLDLNF